MIKKLSNWKRVTQWLILSSLFICTATCKFGGLGKRVTTVTGQVVDEALQPEENVVVFMSSAGLVRPGVPLGDTRTDKDGKYTLVVDVPKGFRATSVGIDFNSDLRLSLKYKDYYCSENGGPPSGLCGPNQIGSKTTYDFRLISQ